MQNAQENVAKKRLLGAALSEMVETVRRAKSPVTLGLMAYGSELGVDECVQSALAAMAQDAQLQVVAFGPKPQGCMPENLLWVETAADEQAVSAALNAALQEGSIHGAVALHYPFPLGVTTIGKAYSPAKGKALYMASCTGLSATERAKAMVLNTIYGIAVAKADGVVKPSVGVLNIDTAATVERALQRLQEGGYELTFGASARQDKGALLRGNDVLTASVDVCVTDSLTGNVLIKTLSAFTSGGMYETVGWGYGPSVGDEWNAVVSIVSRASGAPVVSNALQFTAQVVRKNLPAVVAEELAKARQAGLDAVLQSLSSKAPAQEESVSKPAAEPADAEIHGIDVLDIDMAAQVLWKQGIYADPAMGCTGPVIKIAQKNYARAKELLAQANYV